MRDSDGEEDFFGGQEHASMGLDGFGALAIVSEKAHYNTHDPPKWAGAGHVDSRQTHESEYDDDESISHESLQSARYPQHIQTHHGPGMTATHHVSRSDAHLSNDYSQYVTSPTLLAIPNTAAFTSTSDSLESLSPTSPGHTLTNGQVFVVKRTFDATLADELLIFVRSL